MSPPLVHASSSHPAMRHNHADLALQHNSENSVPNTISLFVLPVMPCPTQHVPFSLPYIDNSSGARCPAPTSIIVLELVAQVNIDYMAPPWRRHVCPLLHSRPQISFQSFLHRGPYLPHCVEFGLRLHQASGPSLSKSHKSHAHANVLTMANQT